MKKLLLSLLSLSLFFLNACSGPFDSFKRIDTTLCTQEDTTFHNVYRIDSDDLVKLYKTNANIFSMAKEDIVDLPKSVYSLKKDNEHLKLCDSNGREISTSGDFNDKNIIECINLLEQLAVTSLKLQYKLVIYKDDLEIKFTIRDLNSYVDYNIVFSDNTDIVGAKKIEGKWYYTINGLV